MEKPRSVADVEGEVVTEPPGPVVAVGTASFAVVAATTYLEAASYEVLPEARMDMSS